MQSKSRGIVYTFHARMQIDGYSWDKKNGVILGIVLKDEVNKLHLPAAIYLVPCVLWYADTLTSKDASQITYYTSYSSRVSLYWWVILIQGYCSCSCSDIDNRLCCCVDAGSLSSVHLLVDHPWETASNMWLRIPSLLSSQVPCVYLDGDNLQHNRGSAYSKAARMHSLSHPWIYIAMSR